MSVIAPLQPTLHYWRNYCRIWILASCLSLRPPKSGRSVWARTSTIARLVTALTKLRGSRSVLIGICIENRRPPRLHPSRTPSSHFKRSLPDFPIAHDHFSRPTTALHPARHFAFLLSLGFICRRIFLFHATFWDVLWHFPLTTINHYHHAFSHHRSFSPLLHL